MKWAADNLDGYLNFYSISGDGRVTNWTIVKTALWSTNILNISFTKQLNNFNQEDALRLLRGKNQIQYQELNILNIVKTVFFLCDIT